MARASKRSKKPQASQLPPIPHKGSVKQGKHVLPAAEREAHVERAQIAPPLPASYLKGTPQLDDRLSYGGPLAMSDSQLDRDPKARLETKKQIRDAARAIRKNRQHYEQQNGVVINPENPLAD